MHVSDSISVSELQEGAPGVGAGVGDQMEHKRCTGATWYSEPRAAGSLTSVWLTFCTMKLVCINKREQAHS